MSTSPRCDGCAFTPGTEANLQPGTMMKAMLCARIAEPFYCHANLVDGQLPDDGTRRLCAGWAAAVGALNSRGYYEQLPEFQREVFSACLKVVIEIEDRLLAGDDLEAFNVPAEVLALLHEALP